ncbi:hypothetical protein C8J56DRAFT_1164445 [Mycena floridula]|nr:hypothetical protein C8J56DRAFT_1164445 [Mycena floridula]
MDIASAVKELIGLGLEIQKSIAKVRSNKQTTAKLSDEIARDLAELESLLSGYSFRTGYELYTALDLVKREMIAVHLECEKLIPKAEKTDILAVPLAKFKAWRKRDDIEAELVRMKDRLHNCLSRFMVYSAARIERSSFRVEHALVGHIVENRVQAQRIGGLLETYLMSSPAGTQIVQQLASVAFNDHSHQTVEYQYLNVLVTRLQDMVESSALRRGFNSDNACHGRDFIECLDRQNNAPFDLPDLSYEAPDEQHSHLVIPSTTRSQELDQIIFDILDTLQKYKQSGDSIQIQDSARILGVLANHLQFLNSGPQPTKLRAWAISLYRSLARKEPAFLPFLALHLSNCNELWARQEAYTICATIDNTRLLPPSSPQLSLAIINKYTSQLIQEDKFTEALPMAETAMEICHTFWVLPVPSMAAWKEGDSWSLEIDRYFEDVVMICETLANLSICHTHAGNLDMAWIIAKECLENFVQLPHHPSLNGDAIGLPHESFDFYHRASYATNRAFLGLSKHMRLAGELQKAYDIMVESFDPVLAIWVFPWEHRASFSEFVELLHIMHNTNCLRYSHLEDFIQHVGGTIRVGLEAISLYALLCLQSAKGTISADHITGITDWDNISARHEKDQFCGPFPAFPHLVWSQQSDLAPQFWLFLSKHMDLVWDCIYAGDLHIGAIVALSFTNNYKGSVSAMIKHAVKLKHAVKPRSLRTLANILEELKQASIPLESSIAGQVLNISVELNEALESEIKLKGNNFMPGGLIEEELLAHCSILDDCGHPQEALAAAEKLLVHHLKSPWWAMKAHELRTRILNRFARYDEAASAARDMLAASEKLEGLNEMWGASVGAALDLLSETLTAAGDSKGATEIRIRADEMWAKNQQYIHKRSNTKQASITEVLEETLINPSTDAEHASSAVVELSVLKAVLSDDAGPEPATAIPEFEPLLRTDLVASPVAACEDTKFNDHSTVPSAIDKPIITLKVTRRCINSTLLWGLAYLVALAAILMAIRR